MVWFIHSIFCTSLHRYTGTFKVRYETLRMKDGHCRANHRLLLLLLPLLLSCVRVSYLERASGVVAEGLWYFSTLVIDLIFFCVVGHAHRSSQDTNNSSNNTSIIHLRLEIMPRVCTAKDIPGTRYKVLPPGDA